MKRSIATAALLICLVVQVLLALVVAAVFDYPLATQRDSWEYVNITDNVIRGHGFSAEPVSPWRPNGTRTPGMLLTNIPMRLIFRGHDAAAAVAGRLWVLVAALLVIALAMEFGMNSSTAVMAGAVLTATPTIAYYSIVVYETEMPYLISVALIFLGLHRSVTTGRGTGFALVFSGSAYAISLRPAALVVVGGLGAAALGSGMVVKPLDLRKRLLGVGACAIGGLLSVYLIWSARNLKQFGTAGYSAIPGHNLLVHNAGGMIPFVGPAAQQEIRASKVRLGFDLHTHYEGDQFEKAKACGREGARLIRKYWPAFLLSHAVGSLRGFALFDVSVLHRVYGWIPIYGVSVFQSILTVVGSVGLVRWAGGLRLESRVALGLMILAGLLSVLTAGAVASPRFRLPLEIPIALGCAWMVSRWFAAGAAAEPTGDPHRAS